MKSPARLGVVGGVPGFPLQDHGADEILLRQEQLRLAVPVHIGRAQPRLLAAAAGRQDVFFIKVLLVGLGSAP